MCHAEVWRPEMINIHNLGSKAIYYIPDDVKAIIERFA